MSDVKIEDLPKTEEISEEELEDVAGGLLLAPKLTVGLTSTALKIGGTSGACICSGMGSDPAAIGISGAITKAQY